MASDRTFTICYSSSIILDTSTGSKIDFFQISGQVWLIDTVSKYLGQVAHHRALVWENTLTLVLLNPDIPWLCKQCRSRSVGFFRSQLIWTWGLTTCPPLRVILCHLPEKGRKEIEEIVEEMNLFVLRFYGPVNPMGSCRVRSVYLTTRLLGRLSPLSGYQYCAHSFARNWQLPFFNQRKGENDRRKYFMINLHERMLLTSAGVEPATSWSPVGRRIQLNHRGRLEEMKGRDREERGTGMKVKK